MTIFFGLLYLLLMTVLIVGLIQPLILKKYRPQPTRKDVLIFLGIPALVVLTIIVIISPPVDYFRKGSESFRKRNYEDAYRYFGKVKKEDKNYPLALIKRNELKLKIDSLNNLKRDIEKPEFVNEVQKTNSLQEKEESKAEITTNSGIDFGNIPGLQPVDVYLNFEKKGFTTEKHIDNDGAIYYSDNKSDGITYQVTTYCEGNVSTVKSIRLNAIRMLPQYNNVEDMKPFLKFGCSIPYDGADSEAINNFIDENYYKNKASIVISGVKFTIYVPTEFARMIDIETE